MTGAPRAVARELVVGITGHRRLVSPQANLIRAMANVRDSVNGTAAGREVTLLSGLAEGVDRWALRVWLESPNTSFVAVLPLPRAAYVHAFNDSDSRREIEQLLRDAREVIELPYAGTPEESYNALARFLVARADVLVAVWDGRPAAGPGGTGWVVAQARAARRPLILIDADARGGNVTYEGWRT